MKAKITSKIKDIISKEEIAAKKVPEEDELEEIKQDNTSNPAETMRSGQT